MNAPSNITVPCPNCQEQVQVEIRLIPDRHVRLVRDDGTKSTYVRITAEPFQHWCPSPDSDSNPRADHSKDGATS